MRSRPGSLRNSTSLVLHYVVVCGARLLHFVPLNPPVGALLLQFSGVRPRPQLLFRTGHHVAATGLRFITGRLLPFCSVQPGVSAAKWVRLQLVGLQTTSHRHHWLPLCKTQYLVILTPDLRHTSRGSVQLWPDGGVGQ
ncbi:hypothetical protein NDU88_001743 [Pleurodeles waltl]|uniref:Secreted protein n=1 Tax=Pleurodeles waltl TaxID=8319 RepID=A0AAV7U7Q7_PLEWA|nr:hypothetical protein NDU88_001743 [Pleurodeles waltl]